jgi:hypothetical protein
MHRKERSHWHLRYPKINWRHEPASLLTRMIQSLQMRQHLVIVPTPILPNGQQCPQVKQQRRGTHKKAPKTRRVFTTLRTFLIRKVKYTKPYTATVCTLLQTRYLLCNLLVIVSTACAATLACARAPDWHRGNHKYASALPCSKSCQLSCTKLSCGPASATPRHSTLARREWHCPHCGSHATSTAGTDGIGAM